MAEPTTHLKFELTLSEAQTILNALGELPYRVSADLIVKFKASAEAQLANLAASSTATPNITGSALPPVFDPNK